MADLSLLYGEEDIEIGLLPVGSAGRKSSGWFGMMTLIATEASLFAYLLFSYYYFVIWSDGAFLPKDLEVRTFRPGYDHPTVEQRRRLVG